MAGLTDTQELLLVIFIVIIFKSIFILCLYKIKKCSEIENYSMTPRHMWRYLCNKEERRQRRSNVRNVNVSSPPTNTTTNINIKPQPPPPYCEPPKYEEAMSYLQQNEPPPPYTIYLTENSVSSDITTSEVSNDRPSV